MCITAFTYLWLVFYVNGEKSVVVSEDFNSCNLMFEMSVFFWKEGVYLISSTYYCDGYILVQCISAVY